MNAAIIVAAGRGTRMGKLDKVFLKIAGRPVVAYCWYALDQSPEIDQIVLVIRPELEDRFRAVARLYEFSKPFTFAPGGPERQDSVWNGLQALPPETELVLIHDAARPCLTQELIHKTLTAAQEAGAAVAATPVVDTIKEADPSGQWIARHLDRSRLWAVQTPQTFRYAVIRKALETVRTKGLILTDDTAACEHIGQPVRLVEWPYPNPKLTHPQDIEIITRILQKIYP